mgnify:CR=1 FL=1
MPRDDKQKPVLYAHATVTLVWIDKKSGESVPLPTSIRGLGHSWATRDPLAAALQNAPLTDSTTERPRRRSRS